MRVIHLNMVMHVVAIIIQFRVCDARNTCVGTYVRA